MIIVDKRKEYYDYLANVHGVDPNIVLDRREGTTVITRFLSGGYSVLKDSITHVQMAMCFCGTKYYGVICRDTEGIIWGQDIKLLGPVVKPYQTMKSEDGLRRTNAFPESRVLVNNGFFSCENAKTDINDEKDCPIYFYTYINSFFYDSSRNIQEGKFPIDLAGLGFSSVVGPQEAYINLTNWLGSRKNDKSSDILTDKEKILSHGMDTKKSFRHRK